MSRSSVKTEDNFTIHRNTKGQIHRLDGPAKYNASKKAFFWMKNGIEHRDYSPSARYTDGFLKWMSNGVLHNTLGPAILDKDKSLHYLNGVYCSKEEWETKRLAVLEKELQAIAKKEKLQLNKAADCFYFSKLGESKICWHRVNGPAFFNLLTGRAAWYQNGSLIRSLDNNFQDEFYNLTEKEWLVKYQPKKTRKKKVKEPVVEVQEAKELEVKKPSTTEEAVAAGELTFKKWDSGGITYYNKTGQEHNPYGPSSTTKDGAEYYFLNGEKHRDNGPSFYDPVLKTEEWHQKGKLHRIGGPALIAPTGKKAGNSVSLNRIPSFNCPTEQWYEEDKRHRLDGPAVVHLDGRQEYWIKGKPFSKLEWLLETKQLYKWVEKHRIFYTSDAQGKIYHNPEGPAEEWSDGSKFWRLNGKQHRDNGFPATEFSNGSKEWWEDGVYFKSINIDGKKVFLNYNNGPKTTSASYVLEHHTDKKGNRHRTDGPAVISQDGTKEYYINGKTLSEDEFNAKYKTTELVKKTSTNQENKDTKLEDVVPKPIELEIKKTYWEGSPEEHTIYYKDKAKTIRHRLDGPAIIHANGHKEYWFDGKRHRLDGPAIIHADGRKEYWVGNKRHRLDGPAIIYADGGKEYLFDNKLHRLNGPAVESADGHKEYWFDGKRHRLDGPAIIYADGRKEYWVGNVRKTESELFFSIASRKKLALQVASNQIQNKLSRMMGNRNKISQHLLTYIAGHAVTSKAPNLGKELRVGAMTHLGLDFLESLEKHLDVSKLEGILNQMKASTEAPLDTSPKPTYIQVSRSERVVSLDANGQEIV